MRAAIVDAGGSVEVTTHPEPSCGPKDVLIKVRTVGINHLDLNSLAGRGPRPDDSGPRVLGIDPAGEVVAQGTAVLEDRVGQSVVVKPAISCDNCPQCKDGLEADCPHQVIVGVHRDGGAAEYVAVPARNAFELPGLDFAVATVAVHSVPIALHALNAGGGVQPGMSVLVTGVSGAVGRAAAQLALSMGAYVVGAANETVSLPGLRDTVVFSDAADLREMLRSRAPEGFDVFVDATGHGGVISTGVSSLAWLGRASILSGTASADLPLSARELYLRRLKILGVGGAGYDEVRRGLLYVANGAVSAPVGERFALEEVALAIDYVRSGPHHGKPVLEIG